MKREAELKSVGSPRRYLVVASQTPSGPGATGGVVQLALATVAARSAPLVAPATSRRLRRSQP